MRRLGFNKAYFAFCSRNSCMPQRSNEEWKSILELAHFWRFLELRKVAIFQLSDKMDAIDRIMLGRKFHVKDWFHSGCVELVMQSEAPSLLIVKSIGAATAVSIFHARESIRKPMSQTYGPATYYCQECDGRYQSLPRRYRCYRCDPSCVQDILRDETARPLVEKFIKDQLTEIERESRAYEAQLWRRRKAVGPLTELWPLVLKLTSRFYSLYFHPL